MFPVPTRDRRWRKVLIPQDRLLDDVEAIPDGQYSGFGRAQHRRRMTSPVKQRRPAISYNSTQFFTLTSRSSPVQVTNATVASQTRQQNGGGPQGPGIRPLSEFVDLPNSVVSGRPYSESQLKPS